MTDEELFAFLSKAEEINFENWKTYRVLYDAKLGKLQDRIQALEAALRSIAANTCCDKCQEAALVARAALGEKKDG